MAARLPATPTDIGLLLLRLILAAVGIAHGSQKLFGAFGGHGISGFAKTLEGMHVPMPTASAYASAGAEFLGGLLIGLGLFTRIAAAVFAFNMFVAIALVHRSAFFAQNQGMEYPLTLCTAALALALTGPGRLSLDARLFRRGRPAAATP